VVRLNLRDDAISYCDLVHGVPTSGRKSSAFCLFDPS